MCKKTFSRYGIPHKVQSENGPQFMPAEFASFSREWDVIHKTSSPVCQQSNGKAESAVKIVKKPMRRFQDPYQALLKYRNTPTAVMSTSPVERMLGRSTRFMLLTEVDNKREKNETVLKEKQKKKLVTQTSHDKGAKDLRTLNFGDPVLLKDFKASKWCHGKILDQLADRSPTVWNENTDAIVYRSRVDLKRDPTSSEIPAIMAPIPD
ncbi:uncharacterized protein [Watersipora subatra]|uniref:uncharacterized protein n=1 Tax=Watersipora subatra TaxID=2589382 RepID=UPI00355C5660